jgi:hypothetical protein
MFITQEDVTKKVNDRVKEVLSGIPINFEIPCGWHQEALKALRNKSARDLGMTGEEYKQLANLLDKEEVLDCYAFAGMNNEIEERTPIQLKYEYALDRYGEVISMCQDLAFKWDEQTKEIRQSTINSVMEETVKRQQKPPINGVEN